MLPDEEAEKRFCGWVSWPQPLSNDVVRAVLDSHDHWDAAAESRVTELIQSVQHLAPPGQDPLPAFSLGELRQCQELDPGETMFLLARDGATD